MAYSPNVQYEAYKRLDCALSAAFFFFSFLNFFTWFCYIEKCFLFYFVFFSFLFLYKTPPTEAGSCGRSESGRTLSSSVEALAGPVRNQRFLLGTHLSAVPSLLPLQFRWSWLSGCGQPRGDTHTDTLTHTHSETDKETRCPIGHAPFEDLWAGLPATPAHPLSAALACCLPAWH